MRPMLIPRDVLVFKALCALDEVVEQARHAPVQPGLAVRFALAYLFAISNGDRRHYDAFWRQVRDEKGSCFSEAAGRYERSTYARTAFTGIARSVGVQLDIAMVSRLAAARRKVGDLKE